MKHPVQGGAVGKMLGQVSAQQINDKCRRLVGHKHRDLRLLAKLKQ
jgi:hypothetical protein